MSKRHDIMSYLTTQLCNISIANGHSFDINNKVFPWRRETLKREELPCIILWDLEANRSSEPVSIGDTSWDLDVSIVVFFSPDTSASAAREAASDVIQVIGDNPMLNGLLSLPIQVMGHELGLEPKSDAVGMVRITLQITYSAPLYRI